MGALKALLDFWQVVGIYIMFTGALKKPGERNCEWNPLWIKNFTIGNCDWKCVVHLLTLWKASLGIILFLIIQLISATCSPGSWIPSATQAWMRFPSHSIGPCWQSKLKVPSALVDVWNKEATWMKFKLYYVEVIVILSIHRCFAVGHIFDVHKSSCFCVGGF